MKHFALLIGCLIFLAACSSAPTPTPAATVDVGAIQTQAAVAIFATQTASVPTATPKPAQTATPASTSTQVHTPTPDVSTMIPPRGTFKHKMEVTEEYDRFKKYTLVRLGSTSDVVSREVGGIIVLYSYPGEEPSIPLSVDIGFGTIHDTWRYLECHPLTFLIDGDPLGTKTEHLGDVLNGGRVSEIVYATLSTNDFLRIVNAKQVEGKLCNDEFAFSEAQMEGLRDAASRMQP